MGEVRFSYAVSIPKYSGIEDLEKVLETLENEEVNYNGNRILLKGVRNYGDPLSVYSQEAYGFLRPKGKTVVDIGASIGDSAIYFVLNGADRVIAYEPFPKLYYFASSNIKANGLSEK
ncbi:MAG: FkbM family methyltransferase [Candidatus Parvarchaeota archaeon]